MQLHVPDPPAAERATRWSIDDDSFGEGGRVRQHKHDGFVKKLLPEAESEVYLAMVAAAKDYTPGFNHFACVIGPLLLAHTRRCIGQILTLAILL